MSAPLQPLLSGNLWQAPDGLPARTLSFSFPSVASLWDFRTAYGIPAEPTQGFAPLVTTEQQAAERALNAWAAVSALELHRVPDTEASSGTLRIAFTSWQMGSMQLGATYLPGSDAKSGDVWLNSNLHSTALASFEPGTPGYFALLHEIGHALGLKHPHEPLPLSPATLDRSMDSMFQTVMSVNVWPGVVGSLAGSTNRYPTTPMSLDIDALQALYGPNTTFASGDDVYLFDGQQGYLQTLFDNGGIDTIVATGPRTARIDLNPGAWSELGQPVLVSGGQIRSAATVQIYRSSWIENARGGDGADVLAGNALDNRLQGGLGDDALDGAAGSDTAVFDGRLANFSLHKDGNGWRVEDKIGKEGVDTLANIEYLQFADKTLPLAAALPQAPLGAGKSPMLLFDAVYYLAHHADLLPVPDAAAAASQHYLAVGAAAGSPPNAYFDAAYYAQKWGDLASLNLDDAALFAHFNLFGLWEGRSPGPVLDKFDAVQYLQANPDVVAYAEAHAMQFMGGRTNAALVHFLLHGADEGRAAVDTAGQPISLGYSIDFQIGFG